jgi:hypothetical protein
MLIDSYLESFAEKFADYQTELLSECVARLCYLEPDEFDMKYSDYIYWQALRSSESRGLQPQQSAYKGQL